MGLFFFYSFPEPLLQSSFKLIFYSSAGSRGERRPTWHMSSRELAVLF